MPAYDWNDRFIPAPAGNSVYRVTGYFVPAVHPRACGEQFMPINVETVADGSSPRLRGTEGI